MTDLHRNQEIAKIKIGQKELGLDDATYRAMLLTRTGKKSAADLSSLQRRAVLEHMKSLGAFKGAPKRARSATARMIHALWKNLETAGALRNPSKQALRAFCGRLIHPGQENVEVDPDFLDIDQSTTVIEALKAWLKRVS
jgi:phage gp16-like protein